MKLGALKQGDKFRYPGQVSGFYVKGSAKKVGDYKPHDTKKLPYLYK